MKAVLKILLIVIIVVSILFLLLLSPFIAADFLGRIQNNKIRNEIFDYVLENQAELEQSISGGYKNFVYTTTGLTPTVSAEYGFFTLNLIIMVNMVTNIKPVTGWMHIWMTTLIGIMRSEYVKIGMTTRFMTVSFLLHKSQSPAILDMSLADHQIM